ncbi:MAG: 50S ribosomal protein L10 [PVC group bacterium]|nr:50S ribosomal protein L10 [PVC group bacterium]
MAHLAKEHMVAEFKDCIKDSSGLIITNFNKLKASEIDSLRRKLEKNSTRLIVAKKTLLKLVLSQVDLSDVSQFLDGQTGLAVFKDDPVSPAKTLFEFSKAHEFFKIRGGVVDGAIINGEKAKELSELPSRDVLIATVLMRMKSPITGFVNVLSGTLRGLVMVLNQIAEKKNK